MSIAAFKKAYAPDRIGREWGFRSQDYAGGSHRGLDVREVHSSGDYSIVTDVVAISDGVVDYVGRPNTLLGPTIRIRRDAGGYEFHSHTIASVDRGGRTTAGTRLGRNAAMSERPGFIFGVHDHIVFSDFADGAWNTDRPTRNPYPFIASVLHSAAATSNSKPFGGFLMALTDPQQNELFAAIKDIQSRIRGPLDRPYDMLQSIDGAVLETRARVRGPLDRNWDMLQEIERLLNGRQPTELQLDSDDAQAIAASILNLLPAVVGTLSPETLAAVAKATADERDRRELERLTAA